MTSTDIAREATEAPKPTLLTAHFSDLASHPAFTVELDTERLDLGLAAAMGKHRRMGR